jgi:serine/threonine-protein kinase
MELLHGSSLAERLRDAGPLPPRDVAAAGVAVLDVLAAAHARGVIHRDVKPSNIFQLSDGGFKVLDFGVARVRSELEQLAPVTQSGVSVGTPGFMAPEQAAGENDEIDGLTDVWAVGATMFQLLTGRLVHSRGSTNATIVAAATEPAPSLAIVAPGLPPALTAIVDRALAFKKDDRWPNARAMQRALLDAVPDLERSIAPRHGPTDLETIETTTPSLQPVPRRGRRSALLAVTIALVALGSAFAMWQYAREPTVTALPSSEPPRPHTTPGTRTAEPSASASQPLPNGLIEPQGDAPVISSAPPIRTPPPRRLPAGNREEILDRRK